MEDLLGRGESVRVLDDFSTGREENLAPFAGRFELHRADLRDADAVRRAVEGVDFVLHQAAIPSVSRSMADPLTSHAANVTGTLQLLHAAAQAGVKRFVYAASSSAYGETAELPKVEGMRELPISPYGVSKFAAELYCRSFAQCFGLHTVCLRYFNVFGPRQVFDSPYTGVIAIFSNALLEGRSPVIFGDGEQTRDFNYIENTVLANRLACQADVPPGRTYNVAGGQRITLNTLVAILQELTGCDAAPEYAAERAGDIRHSLAGIEAARNELGYEPPVDVREGLRRTVAWYRELRQAGGAG